MGWKILLSVLILVFLTTGIYAQCNSTQIDINSANATVLDNLYGIGPAKAQNIISYREMHLFSSVDDLINVSGIGSSTLEKIKQQGLACVNSLALNNSSNNTTENISGPSVSPVSGNSEPQEASTNLGAISNDVSDTPQVINLNPSSTSGIKSKIQVNFLNPGNLATYGLVAFCVVLGALFAVRKLKTKRYKSEFD